MDKLDRLSAVPRYVGNTRRPPTRIAIDELLGHLADKIIDGFSTSRIDAGLAKQLGYSTTQFRRICLTLLGEPVGSFLRRARLERAAGRLTLEQTSIAEISHEAGYLSEEAFSKAFHAHFECSPSTFRSLNQSPDCLMPGYLIARGLLTRLPKTVVVRSSLDRSTTFIYDGPIFLARILPSGVIDWRPR